MKRIQVLSLIICFLAISSPLISRNKIKTIYVSNSYEFLKAIGPNRNIIMKSGDYLIYKDLDKINSGFISMPRYGKYPVFENLKNLHIIGKGRVRILNTSSYGLVFKLVNSQNIQIENITFGHTKSPQGCWTGVIELDTCKNISIKKTILFGSGRFGLHMSNVKGLKFINSQIHHCTEYAVYINTSSDILFNGSSFNHNRFRRLFQIKHSKNLVIRNSLFYNNYQRKPYNRYETPNVSYLLGNNKNTKVFKVEGCTFKNNKADFLTENFNAFSMKNNIIKQNYFNKKSSYGSKSYYQQMLLKAVKLKIYSKIKEALVHGADINVRIKRNETVFSEVLRSDYKMLFYFIKNGALQKLRNKNDGDFLKIFKNNNHGTNVHWYAITDNVFALKQLASNDNINDKNRGGDTPLHCALKANSYNTASFLIKRGANINVENGSHLSPLNIAIKEREVEIVKLLMKRGAQYLNPNSNYQNHETIPLFYAMKYGTLEIVKLLLKNNADIDVLYKLLYNEHLNPLSYAAYYGRLDIVKLFIDTGLNVNSSYGDYSPLSSAALNRHFSVVKYLIGKGANINHNNDIPLYFAVKGRDEAIIRYLLDHGAKVDVLSSRAIKYARKQNLKRIYNLLVKAGRRQATDLTRKTMAFQKAVRKGNLKKVRFYLENGASVGNPLLDAVETGNLKLVKYLLSKSVQYRITSPFKTQKAMLTTIDRNYFEMFKLLNIFYYRSVSGRGYNSIINRIIKKNRIVFLQYLVKKNIPFKSRFTSSYRYKQTAFKSSNPQFIKILLKNDVPFDAFDILSAIQTKKIDVAKFLVEQGVEINSPKFRDGPLHEAVEKGNLKFVRYLVNKGADVNRFGKYHTPLSYAVRLGNREIVDFLLKKGANIKRNYTGRDRDGRYNVMKRHPAVIARAKGYKEIYKMLLTSSSKQNCISALVDMDLVKAVKNGNLDRVKYCIKNGASLDLVSKYDTHIFFIALNKPDIFKYLISQKPFIDLRKEMKTKYMKQFAYISRINIMKYLFDNNIAVNGKIGRGNSLFHFAVISGNIKSVKFLINRGADINLVDYNGDTPLMMAVKKYRWEKSSKKRKDFKSIIYHLISKGAQINIQNIRGYNVLHLLIQTSRQGSSLYHFGYSAARKEHELIKLFLKHKINRNAKDVNGLGYISSMLKGQVLTSHERSNLKFLFSQGISYKQKDIQGNTPLHYAKCTETIKILMKRGADINARNVYGQTPLFMAKKNVVFFYLISQGARIDLRDFYGNTLLHEFGKKRTIVRYLIKNGADISALNLRKQSVIEYSGYKPDSSLLKFYLENGIRNPDELVTIIKLLMKKHHYNTIEMILSLGISMNIRDKNGYTLLMHAVKSNNIHAVDFLLHRGAIVSFNSFSGQNAVGLACRHQDREVLDLILRKRYSLKFKSYDDLIKRGLVNKKKIFGLLSINKKNRLGQTSLFSSNPLETRLLLKFNIKVNARDSYGNTAFMKSVFNDNLIKSKILLDHGANPNIGNRHNITPLMAASRNGSLSLVKFLIKNGSEVNLKDNDGWTAVMWASEEGFTEVVKMLHKAGASLKVIGKAGCSPLILSKVNGNKKLHKYLEQQGIKGEKNYKKNFIKFRFFYATKNWKVREYTKLLKNLKPDVVDKNGMTPLHFMANSFKYIEDYAWYIKKMKNIDKGNFIGSTPLMLVRDIVINTRIHSKDNTDFLLKLGAKISARDKQGRTVLMHELLRRHRWMDKIQKLIVSGADVNAKSLKGTPALFYLLSSVSDKYMDIQGFQNTLLLMLNSGADINGQDANGRTMLMALSLYKRKFFVSWIAGMLLRKGADVNIKDKRGRTALEYALMAGNLALANLYLENGASYNGHGFFVAAKKYLIYNKNLKAFYFLNMALSSNSLLSYQKSSVSIMLGEIYYKEKRYAMALRYFNLALRYKKNSGTALYNIACIYALQNKKQEAIAMLKKAIASGYNDYYQINFDKDLASIRKSRYYKDLMERIR